MDIKRFLNHHEIEASQFTNYNLKNFQLLFNERVKKTELITSHKKMIKSLLDHINILSEENYIIDQKVDKIIESVKHDNKEGKE